MKKNRIMYLIVLIVAFLAFTICNADAALIYSTFGSTYDDYDHEHSWIIGDLWETSSHAYEYAVPFTPTGNYENIEFTFAASNMNGSNYPEVNIILATGGSLPYMDIEYITLFPISGSSSLYTASFNSDLTAGTQYWIIMSPSNPGYTDIGWNLSLASSGHIAWHDLAGGPWYSDSRSLYSDPVYEVSGDLKVSQVPEPATILLIGSGLIGLGLMRRK